MAVDGNKNDELKLIHSSRGNIYRFCSKCFSSIPSEDIYKMIEGILSGISDMASNSHNVDILEGACGLNDFVKSRSKLKGEELSNFDLETLRKYTSLFCVKGSVQADESYYTSPKGLVMQESRDEMLELFSRYGFQLAENAKEYEDHISVELAFMSKLAYSSLQSGDKSCYTTLIDEQLNFHKNHFDKWAEDFFKSIINFPISNELLFTSIAKFTKGFIAEDKLLLEELVLI